MATKIKSSNIEAAAVTSAHLHNDTVTGLTEVTTLDYTNDFTLVYDASDSSLKKIQAGNFAPPLDLSAVDQHIIPDGNELYDLGEPENKFRDLYLSTGTIHMGTTKMSIDTTTGDMVIKGADDLPRGIKAKSVELDDVNEDATFKTVMRKENGKVKFVRVNRSTGIEDANVAATDLSSNDTDDIAEGSTNLYYTDTRVRSVLTTDSIANESYVDTAISNLIGGAPAALDTLNELAAAIGDDDSYAASVTTSLGTKAAKATTISAGTGLTGGGDLSTNRTLALAASGVSAGTYGSSTAIPVLVVDTYGRITSVSNTNITVGDGTLTVASGSGLSGSGTFTANQTTNGTITLSHADTSSASSVNNSGSTVIQDITLDGFGHITAIGSTDLSSQFLGITAKAADSDLLDGISSASFLRSDVDDSTSGYIDFTTGLQAGELAIGGISSAATSYNVTIQTQNNGSMYLQYDSVGDVILCKGGGNVGIGTTSPYYKLAVHHPADVWHAQFGTVGGKQFRIGGSTTNGAVIGAYNNDSNDSPASLILQRDGGNVGIGTASPSSSYKLDVNGGVRASSFSGNGSSLTNVNAASLNGYSSTDFTIYPSQSFQVTGDGDKFYKVLISFPSNAGRKFRVYRPYSSSIGGSNANWNSGHATHFGALEIDGRFSDYDWSGSQKALTFDIEHQYTVVCGRAYAGNSAEYHGMVLYLRGGTSVTYYIQIEGYKNPASQITIDYNSYITTPDDAFNATNLNKQMQFYGVADFRSGLQIPTSSSDPGLSNADKLGRMYFNTNNKSLKIHDGEDWGEVIFSPLGSVSNPAQSGIALMDAGMPSGMYYIQPTGYGSSFYTYVNNDTDGGGWVLFYRTIRDSYDGIAFSSNRDMSGHSSTYSDRFLAPWNFMDAVRGERSYGNSGRSQFLTYITNSGSNAFDSHSGNNWAVIKPNSSGQDFTDGSGNGVNDIPTYGKIRGYQIQDQIGYWSGTTYDTRWWYNNDANYSPHFDTSSTGVPGSIGSEDAFGWTTTNSGHWQGTQFLCWFIR